jgi:hypothetical protein
LVVVCFGHAGFLLLIFFSAPTSLRELPVSPLIDDLLPQALVSLLRGDVIDSGVVMLRVAPG